MAVVKSSAPQDRHPGLVVDRICNFQTLVPRRSAIFGAFVLFAIVPLLQGGGAAMRAALEYVAKEKAAGTVEVDPRELIVGAAAADGSPAKTHSQALLSLLTVPNVSTVADMERARDCNPDPFAPMCKKNGRAVFVSLSAPKVEGKNATIEVRLSLARTPNAADSAESRKLKTADERDAFLRRVARPATSKYRIELLRETTTWIVSRALLIEAR